MIFRLLISLDLTFSTNNYLCNDIRENHWCHHSTEEAAGN